MIGTEKVKSPGLMLLMNVRTSHLYVFEPYTGKPSPQIPNPKPMFKGDFLMDATHPDLARVAHAIEIVGSTHKWKSDVTWAQVKEQLKAQDKLCLHRGDVSQAGQPEYAGKFFVKANNQKRFTILDGLRNPMAAGDKNAPYSGCWVNATIDIYAQDNQFGRRINATLTGVQFVRHDEAFGGGARAADPSEFPVLATSADAAAPTTAAADPLAGLV
jgi:hypothetical protein